MANTLKDPAATTQLVDQTGLERALRVLKAYVDARETAMSSRVETLENVHVMTAAEASALWRSIIEV